MTFAWYIPDDYTFKKFCQGSLDYNNPEKYDECSVQFWGSVDFVKEGLRRHNSIIRNIAKEEQVMLIDIERMDAFSNNSQNFGDVCHFSENGTEIFVKTITDFFLSKDLLAVIESTK
jgi:hypothetical protein